MRDLIHCLAIWLGPGLQHTWERVRIRVRKWVNSPPSPPSPQVLAPRPIYDRRALPPHVCQRRKPLDGHEIRLVRPYYLIHEQQQAAVEVRRLQRERRTAAALASLGIDYDPALALGVLT